MSRFDKYAANTEETLHKGASAKELAQNWKKGDNAMESGEDVTGEDAPEDTGGGGGGEMTAEEVREKFGFEFNKEHAEGSGSAYSRGTGGDGFTDEGAIYTENGEYIGTINPDGDDEYYAGFQAIGDAASPIKQEAEGKGFSNFSSLSDVAGAAHWLTKGAEEEKTETEKPPTWNEATFSPQVQEAIDRAESYRERAISGVMANEVFGKSNELAKGSPYYKEPGDESNNGAQMASDSATEKAVKHFDVDKYKQDYSAEYVA